METLDYDHSIFSAQSSESDKNLFVRFFTTPLKNDDKSTEAGRPIYEDTEMVEIRVRGSKDNVVNRPVRDDDKRRFKEVYRAFKEDGSEIENGTPLAEWPAMSASMVEELKYLKFFTVEQLSNASDGVGSAFPGFQTWKAKAKAFLEYAKDSAPIEQLTQKLRDRDNEMDTLKRQMAETLAEMSVLRAAQKKDGK